MPGRGWWPGGWWPGGGAAGGRGGAPADPQSPGRLAADEVAPVLAQVDRPAFVALGNPLYVPLVTAEGRERLAGGLDVDAVLGCLVAADRAVFAGLEVPENFRLGLDLADSGPLPTTGRGYDPAALDALLDETPFHWGNEI